MRKHGTNRPSIAAILAISALLVTSLVGSAFAGNAGSKSVQGSAAWLVNQTEGGCDNGSINTSDNVISNDGWYPGVWVKSSDSRINIYDLDYTVYDKGNNVVGSGALVTSGIGGPCGEVYWLFELSNGFPSATGSLTIKIFTSEGTTFGNDSARFV